MSARHIMIVAGEASGDAHAGRMIAQLKTMAPDIRVSGVGGAHLRAAGTEIIVDFSQLAVMGIVEVLQRYRHIKKIFTGLVELLDTQRPELLILVDYPGFNLKLAKEAKKRGIPVFYYISPKIWAWRAGRIKTIKKYVDFMAVLFPFEVPIYQKAGVPVQCVGHPLRDVMTHTLSRQQAREKLGYPAQQTLIGLFPGSRYSEVVQLLPLMQQAAQTIIQSRPDIQFIIPLAPGLDKTRLLACLQDNDLPVTVSTADFATVTSACDTIVAASGTVTLEIALAAVPHFLVYRLAPLSYQLLKRLVKVPYVGLCNIVTGRPVILELLQHEVTPQRIAKELLQRLDEDSRTQAADICQQVRQALGPAGASHNCARQVLALLAQS